MKIQKIIIHNFRSIEHEEIHFQDYSILLGENNAGKSNIVDAIRFLFHLITLDKKVDYPKFVKENEESWVEVHFLIDEKNKDKWNKLMESKLEEKIIRFRKYLFRNNSDYFFFINKTGDIDKKNKYAQHLILGNLIYIPASNHEEISFLNSENTVFNKHYNEISSDVKGSDLKKTINYFIWKIAQNNVLNSDSFSPQKDIELLKSIVANNESFTFEMLAEKINENIKEWGIHLKVFVNSLNGKTLDKNFPPDFPKHIIIDKNFKNNPIEIDYFGEGFQRILFYFLIKTLNEYDVEKIKNNNSVFVFDFSMILFEEPETFLHPWQQENMDKKFKEFSEKENQQTIITTHSPIFVSKNIKNINSLLRIEKHEQKTKVYPQQLTTKTTDLKKIFKVFSFFNIDTSMAFFAKNVIVCEGYSEKFFFEHLLDENDEFNFLKNKSIYFLNCLSKENIEKCIDVLEKFNVNFFVFYDLDNKTDDPNWIKKRNENFKKNKIYPFDKNFEDFLGIKKLSRSKSWYIMESYEKNKANFKIPVEKLKEIFKKWIS